MPICSRCFDEYIWLDPGIMPHPTLPLLIRIKSVRERGVYLNSILLLIVRGCWIYSAWLVGHP